MQPIPEHLTTRYKVAKWAVIILSALIILALFVLVAGVLRKPRDKSAPLPTVAGENFTLPRGAVLTEMQSQPGRLILRARNGGAEEIYVVDLQNGRLVTRIRSEP
jgi:hypothetical protein